MTEALIVIVVAVVILVGLVIREFATLSEDIERERKFNERFRRD